MKLQLIKCQMMKLKKKTQISIKKIKEKKLYFTGKKWSEQNQNALDGI